jgi:hypothetical protein
MCQLEVHSRDDEGHDVRRRKLVDAHACKKYADCEFRTPLFVLKSRAAASGTAVDERRSVYLKRGVSSLCRGHVVDRASGDC